MEPKLVSGWLGLLCRIQRLLDLPAIQLLDRLISKSQSEHHASQKELKKLTPHVVKGLVREEGVHKDHGSFEEREDSGWGHSLHYQYSIVETHTNYCNMIKLHITAVLWFAQSALLLVMPAPPCHQAAGTHMRSHHMIWLAHVTCCCHGDMRCWPQGSHSLPIALWRGLCLRQQF